MAAAKRLGFSDLMLARMKGKTEIEIRKLRISGRFFLC